MTCENTQKCLLNTSYFLYLHKKIKKDFCLIFAFYFFGVDPKHQILAPSLASMKKGRLRNTIVFEYICVLKTYKTDQNKTQK